MQKISSNVETIGGAKESGWEQKTVFLADSCEISCQLLGSLLLQEGYEILRFNSGVELLESLLNGANPDLLLIGMVLPGMSGLELLARLNAARIKITSVMVGSSHAMTEVSRAYSYGAVDFILKPLDLKEVLLRVRLSMQRTLGVGTIRGTA